MPEKRTSRQEPRRLKTRLALMRAGADLLARRPIDAIAVNDIVDAAGVAKGSFFNHFEDKGDFAAAIAAEIRMDVEARVTAANLGILDPAQRVVRATAGFVQFALAEPKRARIMLRGHEWATGADHPLNQGLRADIDQGVESGRFRPEAASAGVLYVVGLCQMLMVAIVNDDAGVEGARRLAGSVLRLALAGLGVREGDIPGLVGTAVTEIIQGAEAPASE